MGKQLNVEAVLEGSLVRDGGRIHIRAQLNRTSDGYHLWSRTYDTPFNDFISVQRDIARSIADDLQLSRSKNANSLTLPPGETNDPEAHDLYLRGLAAANLGTPAGVQQAVPLLQSAMAKDPHYAAPWFATAKTLEGIGVMTGWAPGLADEIRADLNQALELNPQLLAAHAHLGYMNWGYGYDWDAAEREFRLALERGDLPDPHKLYAMALADQGRFAESHAQLRIAEDLGPLDLELWLVEGGVLASERKYAEAEKKFQAILRVVPNNVVTIAALGYLMTWEKDCKRASEYANRLEQIAPGEYRTVSVRFAALVCAGEIAQAKPIIERDVQSGHAPALELAEGYAYMGDKEKALEYLQKAVDQHAFGATGMKQAPYLDSLHGDARFHALEKRVGLEQ